MSSSEWLNGNFQLSYQLLDRIGGNIFDRRWRPNRRTFYTGAIMLLATVEILYLLWTDRSNVVKFLEAFQNAMVVGQAVHMVSVGVGRLETFRELQRRMVDIQELLGDGGGNDRILNGALRMSRLFQKFILMIYTITSVVIIFGPNLLWVILDEKIFIMVYFVPGIDGNSTEGFLLNLTLHAIMLPAAICVYVSLECTFMTLIIPVGAYVDAFGNEVSKLNSALNLPERNEAAIHEQLNRIVRLHQLLIEYESKLQELYSLAILVKIGLVYLGIISAIVVIFKSHDDRIAYNYLMLQFEHLTRYCMMGTVITDKNDQLLEHIADINWYQMDQDQAMRLILMLLLAQNATSVTIGNFRALNAETYVEILKSIYSYAMVLNALFD
ncbi:putative odorant receptor 83c [Culex quinquefasciatus]|uniref:putative odorant receptor 83c n=1 Tax=Culex quinquefasciatus TaxID=7176 RepID=UPI0018E34D84|nr:putative odorant receptor 83c [Culex quinquefasciatus]